MSAIYAIFLARFKEFYRDRASLGWNFLFPFFVIFAFYFAFSGEGSDVFQVGVVSEKKVEDIDLPFLNTKYITFKNFERERGIQSVERHKLDLLIEPTEGRVHYWINSSSKNGYFVEQMLLKEKSVPVLRAQVSGAEVKYIDWVFPGILGMNIMFNCLWGVGYSIVKYRQDGYLKRLKATPVKAYQFLLSQVFARYVIAFLVTAIVYFGSKIALGFEMNGSYLDLMLIFTAGITCLMSIGLLVASRTTSKEFADGVLNLASWPMMFLSGVWFSLESASEGLVHFANLLPLTHMVSGMRAVMVDGAGLAEIAPQIGILVAVSAVLIALSSFLFKWSED